MDDAQRLDMTRTMLLSALITTLASGCALRGEYRGVAYAVDGTMVAAGAALALAPEPDEWDNDGTSGDSQGDGIGGVAAALIITQNPLSMPVLIGILMLMGIVAKNAILLIDFAIEMRVRGMDRIAAVIEAGHKRARPIVQSSKDTAHLLRLPRVKRVPNPDDLTDDDGSGRRGVDHGARERRDRARPNRFVVRRRGEDDPDSAAPAR